MQTIEQRMTLRRFVRVTFDNLRQLLQTISAPVTSLPMPQIAPQPSEHPGPRFDHQPDNQSINDARAANSAADNTAGSVDDFGGDTVGDQQVNDEQAGDEQVGDQQVGNDPLGGGAPIADAPGSDALSADPSEPEALATGVTTQPDETMFRVTSSPAHEDGFPLAAALESLLFVSDEAVEPLRLAQALGLAPAEAEAALLALDVAYREERRGLRLQVRNGRYQLVTAPEAANLIETYLNLDAGTRLSAPALETLAVVAYRQPVTRAQIEAVRGVDCSGVLRSLIGRGLLEEVGRLDAPGRPVLYGITDLFMHHFGLTALHELPPLEDAENAAIEEVGA